MDKIEKELRLLKGYALFSTILFAALIFLAVKGPSRKVKFQEIDAERINIVEPNGTVRLAMANRERMPGGQSAGVELTAREGNRVMSNHGPVTAGLTFFNDEGDECGGLVYGTKMVDGKQKTVVRLSFDHYRQNEAIDIVHAEEGGVSRSGLEAVDTGSSIFTADEMRQSNAILLMKDGPGKDAALKKFGSEHAAEFKYAPRLFVGRLENDAAGVILMDTQSKPRIRMTVDASGAPSLQFLDEHGKTTYSLSEHGIAGNKKPPTH